MNLDLFYMGIEQALVLAFVALAVMIPFRLLHFPDLTAEGAYPLGGALCASLLLLNVQPFLAIVIASITTGLLGVATGLIHLRFKVNTLLTGIILSTMMYSVNLRLMGRPNIALFNSPSLFSETNILTNIAYLSILLFVLIALLFVFLRTEFGLTLRAVGLNKDFSCRQGISVEKFTLFGLFLAGCFTGMGGAFIVQLQHYMDVGMGVGIVIHALAALMIGEAVLGQATLSKQIFAPLIGALIYQQIQGIALSVGLAPSDLKLFTGGLVLVVIAIQRRGKLT